MSKYTNFLQHKTCYFLYITVYVKTCKINIFVSLFFFAMKILNRSIVNFRGETYYRYHSFYSSKLFKNVYLEC